MCLCAKPNFGRQPRGSEHRQRLGSDLRRRATSRDSCNAKGKHEEGTNKGRFAHSRHGIACKTDKETEERLADRIQLGLDNIAENMRESMSEKLEEMGCDYQQGYYFSRPVTESDFLEYLRSGA